jgi:hypothetical protein
MEFAMPTDATPSSKVWWANLIGASFFCGCLVADSAPALAFRPFDGTDASVAELGHIDLELQPFGALQEGPSKSLVAPATVFNYGFAQGWEAVLQGQLETEISPTNHESVNEAGFFLKHIFREGSLQDKSGPSIAAEFGLNAPTIGVNSAVGPSWDWIISQRYPWGTIHVNVMGSLTTDQHTDLFLDLILEGPSTWTVRPVAEFFSDTELHGPQVYSALVGGIWQVREDLAVDFAVRHAISDHTTNELRLGLTYSFPVDQPQAKPSDSIKTLHPAR